jgi:putative selenium metabolism protein SsnA
VLIVNGTVVTFDSMQPPSEQVIPTGAIAIEGSRIVAVGPEDGVRAAYPGHEVVDARGGVVLPGFINLHTHLYSAFARGMALPGEAPRNFPEILERLWWKLDKALTLEDCHQSALCMMVEAVAAGSTTLFDHHASPGAVRGSLDAIAGAARQVGIRACLCYEVSDRDGPAVRDQGLEENADFIKACGDGHALVKALLGLHAAFTLEDGTLARAGERAQALDVGCHIHVAEDPVDDRTCRQRFGSPLIERLVKHHILTPKTIVAHCIHLDGAAIRLLGDSGAMVAHNPQSNANNAVGVAPLATLRLAGCPIGLGTDGYTHNMLSALVTMTQVHKLATGDPRTCGFAEPVAAVFETNATFASQIFGAPLGRIAPGALADLVVWDYVPYTPLTAANVPGHLIFGFPQARARTVVVDGKVVMRDGEFPALDRHAIAARGRELAARLWQRLGAL